MMHSINRRRVMKLMKLLKETDFKPNVQSSQARILYRKMLDYLIMSDDPKYEKIKSFRRAIVQLTDPMDREQMIKYFNIEFSGVSSTPWDYYK